MRDRIDERNERERIAKSIIKYWNVNYIPTPKQEEPETSSESMEDVIDTECANELYERAESSDREEAYNVTTGSYSGEYGRNDVKDEVTKGQIEKILHEKTDAIRSLFEQNEDESQNI